MIHLFYYLSMVILASCNAMDEGVSIETSDVDIYSIDKKFKEYWYAGEAEITSFKLSQARYGELREGSAALVFVTEPFSSKSNTKTDDPNVKSTSVLKLNTTKKFNTGIYPYSMMSSTFLPVENGDHSLKVSASVQEWCGHMYMEMRNRSKFEIDLHSYFEGESFLDKKMEKVELEDDIWSKIRLQPDDLPIGKIQMLPSFFYFRFSHTPVQSFTAKASIKNNKNGTKSYEIEFPAISRKLTIDFESSFPYRIVSWQESQRSGYRKDAKIMTTSATMVKTIKSAYWQQNSNSDGHLRKELGLE